MTAEKEAKDTKENKPDKEKKTSTKVIETTMSKADAFAWSKGTMLEKSAFIGSVVFLVAAIVFLIFEFVAPAEAWPFISFDFAIALAFACETLSRWRFNRRLAIITGICGGAFLILAFLKLFGVISA